VRERITVSETRPQRRLPKAERHAQLLAEARELIREAGTDDFSLGRLAERAGVTKPLVYDHFGDRAGVFAELYREFESRQRETLRAALRGVRPELSEVSDVVAAAYIDCCLAEGHELADVVAALAGSATLTQLRHEAEEAYVTMCRNALAPLSGPLDPAGFHAIIGAGNALAQHALSGSTSASNARATLARIITTIATPAPGMEDAR